MVKRVDGPTYKKFITGPIERFDERNTGYSRGDRGEIGQVVSAFERGAEDKKDAPGYSFEDYAVMAGAHVMDTISRRTVYGRESLPKRWALPKEAIPVLDKGKMSEKVKRVARWYGADLVGICELNRSWIYSHWGDHTAKLSQMAKPGDPVEIPEEYRYAVVIAVEMDYEMTRRSPAVNPSVFLAYSRQAFVAASVSQFIRYLGYRAIASGNDISLSVPIAIDAGLGELGRHGLLITAEYGPRVRISKVYTDLPLETDKPIDIGVQNFCEICGKCSQQCPSQAIPNGERTDQPRNISNNSNVLKWPIHADRCLGWWARNRTACTNCIRSCPFNKPRTLLHKLTKELISRTHICNSILVKIDDMFGYGKQVIKEVP